MANFSAGDVVTIDAGQQGRIERNVGGDDYIVRTASGQRVAIGGFRLRLVPKPTPVVEAPPAEVKTEAPPAPPAS